MSSSHLHFLIVFENEWSYVSTPLYPFMAWTVSILSLLFISAHFCSFNNKTFFFPHLFTDMLTHFFEFRSTGKRNSGFQAFQQADTVL